MTGALMRILLPFVVISLFVTSCCQANAQENQQIVETAVGTVAPDVEPGKYVYYCQWSSPWRDVWFNSGTVAHYGCGPTSKAMIFSSFGVEKKPGEIAKEYDENGFSWIGSSQYHGSNLWLVSEDRRQAWLRSMGFSSARVNVELTNTANIASAKKYLDQGYILYGGAVVSNWAGFSGGHSFVVTGVTGSTPGEVIMGVIDPNDSRSCLAKKVIKISNGTIDDWYFLVPIRKL
jgi:hypothetical protein